MLIEHLREIILYLDETYTQSVYFFLFTALFITTITTTLTGIRNFSYYI